MHQSFGKNQPSPSAPYNAYDKFARINNNPNVRNAQYYTPIVPTYKGSYRPEFGKSPLTSVEMYRKNKSRSINFDEAPVNREIEPTSDKNYCSNINWKKIMMWALIALAFIGFIVGLVFLIKALVNKDDGQNIRTYRQPDISNAVGYTGINPIYVSPIPYNNMQVPTVSGYVASPTLQDRYVYQTAPAITAPSETAKTTQEPKPQQVNPVTQPTVRWTPNESENFVNPVDVYGYSHN